MYVSIHGTMQNYFEYKYKYDVRSESFTQSWVLKYVRYWCHHKINCRIMTVIMIQAVYRKRLIRSQTCTNTK